MAVNSRRKGPDGEQVERTDWFRVRAMGSKAEYVQRFTKGQRVLVTGRLEISDWRTREGEPRTSFDIWADDIVNISPREDGPRGQGETATNSALNGRPAQPVGARPARPAPGGQDEDLEDLPSESTATALMRRAYPQGTIVLFGADGDRQQQIY